MIKEIAHIILAAGASTRMGSPKQLLPWKEESLIVSEIKKVQKLSQLETYVILGANFDLINKEIEHLPVRILYNQSWQSGMGTSISTGVRHIMSATKKYKAVLISLIDQPFIDLAHFNNLIQHYTENPNAIVATAMQAKIGVPAMFSSIYFEELSELKEDFGARYIIKKYKDKVITLDGKNKTDDMDTMEQYRLLIKRLKE
ncbi:nucleotidyltransferase family protein [uncultured Aquimarina sp.]|uniref:nucleotidyltransferase family protein n=1 Tax=uncultured Aquimarina sp. TaxID=575652 RepID=UPI003457E5AA